MEKRILYIVSLLMLVFTQTTKAQTLDEIDWSKYAKSLDAVVTTNTNNPKYILLYNKSAVDNGSVGSAEAFAANTGMYGVQANLSAIGNRFYITKHEKGNGGNHKIWYQIHSDVNNPGDRTGNCVAIKLDGSEQNGDKNIIVVDRANSFNSATGAPNWTLTDAGSNAYNIQNCSDPDLKNDNFRYKNYLCYNKGMGFVHHSATQNDKWYFILDTDYIDVIKGLVQNSYVNITGLIRDGNFSRYNVYEEEWKVLGCGGQSATITDALYQPNGTYMASQSDIMKTYLIYKSHIIGTAQTEENAKKLPNYNDHTPWLFWKDWDKYYCAGIYACGGYQ